MPQEAPRRLPRGPKRPLGSPKRPSKGSQEAPENAPKRPREASLKTLTHNPGTVAGWTESHQIRRPVACHKGAPGVHGVPNAWQTCDSFRKNSTWGFGPAREPPGKLLKNHLPWAVSFKMASR
eukprot:2412902-Pyramimonas_sp.AAC.1